MIEFPSTWNRTNTRKLKKLDQTKTVGVVGWTPAGLIWSEATGKVSEVIEIMKLENSMRSNIAWFLESEVTNG